MQIKLSDAQKNIVEDRSSRLQVIACAGSGKTESISRRVASLIKEGASPESIVAFTFTEKAATELKDRIYKRVSHLKGKEFLGRLGPMFVGTIHAYCFRMLQDYVPKYGNYDVLDEHQHVALISRRRHELRLECLDSKQWKSIEIFLRAADVIGNELIPIRQLEGTEFGECYAAYREMLDRYHFLTFGMVIANAIEVLQSNQAVYDRVRRDLRHLIVDEYQDINPAQERLIELLAKEPVNLCVVGDDDQAIYQWRGSDVGNILNFQTRYKNSVSLKLETNRRSRPEIIKASNSFATGIENRLDKEMKCSRPAGPCEVVPWISLTSDTEAETIASHVKELHSEGWRYQDIAVLYRSVRTSAPPLVAAFQDLGIPFNCGGRTGLFTHPEIDCFGELFAWVADFSWKDENFEASRNADLSRAVAGLGSSFRIPEKEWPDLAQYFTDWKSWISRSNRRVSLVGDFYKHLRTLGIETIDPDTSVGSARLGAFAKFAKILADYEHVTIRSRWDVNEDGETIFRSGRDRGKSFWAGLANYLLHYAKQSYEDFEGEEVHNLDAVSILTVHQSKGLEWPILFIPSLTSRRFPSSMSGRGEAWPFSQTTFPNTKRLRYEGCDADERRLFYVAMTRARDVLYASTFQRMTNKVKESPYLLELAESLNIGPLPSLGDLPLPTPPITSQVAEHPVLELGYSDLADYEECGYAYRLSRIFGFERELVSELGYGRAIHHVLRHIAEEAAIAGKTPSPEEIKNLIERELYIPFANEATYSNMRRSVNGMVNRYVEDWAEDLNRIWATERPFEIHLGEGILVGRADVILDEEDGKINHLAIVDYKTATDKEREERYEKQLTVYAAAGDQEGLQVDACYLHELKNSKRVAVQVNEKKRVWAVSWAADRVKEIASGIYPIKASPDKCERCDFKMVCRHSCAAIE